MRFQYKSKFKSPCLTPVFQRPVPVTPARQRHKLSRQPFGGDPEGASACVVRTQQPTYTSVALHDTVLKRYRVAAGSARPLRDYHLMHDSSFIHDYRLPRDPSAPTTIPSFTTTARPTIPLWKSLPESRPATTIPLSRGKSLRRLPSLTTI